MHEMALAESVVEIVEDHARKAGSDQVKRVRLEIGALSHVMPEAMEFCFEAVARGSRAEGAVLEVLRIPGRAWCHGCAKEVEVTSLVDACPECGGVQLQVTGGEDMRIKDMEVA